ncbi:hypothetical protein [Actinacidiphila sp. ITFR-21]|uniref:hypothetical protein n=1 Tax=Actinacidiphila sp. ITFR-21 TaxID=3075199 RepID=UPI00288B93F5|nr:hypothetical protein [Streptomyces sp. ITFR-21]WNI15665.1 hypothetical protein RLT57_09060 [Streptomyces sp. ITFR-21]
MDEQRVVDVAGEARRPEHSGGATAEGAAWLTSAAARPGGAAAAWPPRPTAPGVLRCGTVFDVVNLPALFGRRVLAQLWAAGSGCGPVAVHRGRVLLLVAPGTAQRLPSLLSWEEWGDRVPPMLCHGVGDAVTLPPLRAPAPDRRRPPEPHRADPHRPEPSHDASGPDPHHPPEPRHPPADPHHPPEPERAAERTGEAQPCPDGSGSRWVVAPDRRHPWLPGAEHVLWACVRAARGLRGQNS